MKEVDDTVLCTVRERLLAQGAEIPGWAASPSEIERFKVSVAQALSRGRLDVLDGDLAALVTRVAGMLTGVGVLQPLLEEPGVEEIIVRNGYLQVEKLGRIENRGWVAPDEHFQRVAERAADLGRRMMKGDRPWVLVDLPDGSRFTAIIPPLSVRGTAINIRVFRRESRSLGDLAGLGAFDGTANQAAQDVPTALMDDQVEMLPPIAQLLASVARGNLASVLIAGEFAAGKTTLLNAMSLCIPENIQVAVVETFEELKIAHKHALRVVVRDTPDGPTMKEVLNVVITRMRPDLLIIGEIVLDEASRFLEAINLGKKAWATIHGSDALGALRRLETLALASGLPHAAIREQVAAGVDLVVHLRQDPWTGRRYVAQVSRVDGVDHSGRYCLTDIYKVRDTRVGVLQTIVDRVEQQLCLREER